MAEENKVVEKVVVVDKARPTKADHKNPRNNPNKGDKRGPRRDSRNEKPEFEERVVTINRVSKTVKGGRRLRFTALVVIGNGNGLVGFGTGKANEVPDAIKKALEKARKNLYKVPMAKGNTFPHTVEGKYGACKVLLRPAPEGSGIIAGGPVRAVLELAGIKNIYSKVYGSRTAINIVRATVKGITDLKTPGKVSALRGKKI